MQNSRKNHGNQWPWVTQYTEHLETLCFFGKRGQTLKFILFEMRALQIRKDSSSDSTALIFTNRFIAR